MVSGRKAHGYAFSLFFMAVVSFSSLFAQEYSAEDNLLEDEQSFTGKYSSILSMDISAAQGWHPDYRFVMKKKHLFSLIGITAAFGVFDRQFSGFFYLHRNSGFRHGMDYLAPYANYLLPAALVGFIAGSALHEERFPDMCFSVLEGAAASGILVSASKFLIGRARPLQNNGDNDEFRPFNFKYSSIPSGHTTLAFTTASVIAGYYPSMSIPAYGMAALIGAQRIVSSRHWTSDVLIGTFLGYYLGKKIVHSHVSLYMDKGIGIAYSF